MDPQSFPASWEVALDRISSCEDLARVTAEHEAAEKKTGKAVDGDLTLALQYARTRKEELLTGPAHLEPRRRAVLAFSDAIRRRLQLKVR